MPSNIVVLIDRLHPDAGELEAPDPWGAPVVSALENAGLSIDRSFPPLMLDSSVDWLVRGSVGGPDEASIISDILRVPSISKFEHDPEVGPAVDCYRDSSTRRRWGTWQNVKDKFSSLGTLDGNGTYIVIVDTGISPTYLNTHHPNFNGMSWDDRFDRLNPGDGTGKEFADKVMGPVNDYLDRSGTPRGPAPLSGDYHAHGSMMAFDTAIAAPKAAIVDLPVLRSRTVTPYGTKPRPFSTLLSSITQVYVGLNRIITTDGPEFAYHVVVNNSWQLHDPASPGGLDFNDPRSTFNAELSRLAGRCPVDVIFAAGNCGHPGLCPRRGRDTIYGANSHPEVLTVAAANVFGCHLSISSEGRGWIKREKPDIAMYSHFLGSRIPLVPGIDLEEAVDGGTSAACAVTSGFVAALRSDTRWRCGDTNKKRLFDAIRHGSHRYDPCPEPKKTGHHLKWGYGIPDVDLVLSELSGSRTPGDCGDQVSADPESDSS